VYLLSRSLVSMLLVWKCTIIITVLLLHIDKQVLTHIIQVTSQAHAHVMGNMSKMMATLGKAMVSSSSKRSKRAASRPSAAMEWYFANGMSTGHPSGHASAYGESSYYYGGSQAPVSLSEPTSGEYTRRPPGEDAPLRMAHSAPIYGQERRVGDVGLNQRARTTDAMLSHKGSSTAPVPPEQYQNQSHEHQHRDRQQDIARRQRRGPPSKYKVVDHVLAKLQNMERAEREILHELQQQPNAAWSTTASTHMTDLADTHAPHNDAPLSSVGANISYDRPLTVPSAGNTQCKQSDQQVCN
jgi:hypothetical protein